MTVIPDRWTPEREQLLGLLYPTAMPHHELLAAILALPGAPITSAQLWAHAKQRGLVRGPAPRGMRIGTAVTREPQASVASDDEALWPEIVAWGRAHGVPVQTGDDLAQVNRRRREMGLLPFQLVGGWRRAA